MTYLIREIKESDWPEVKAIYEAGIATGLATFETESPTYARWIQNSISPCRLLLTEHERVLGWCKLTAVSSRPVYQGVGELSIYIHSDERGKGIGNLLLKRMIRVSEKNGYWTIQAHIFPENQPSLLLHFKNGFREVGHRERIGQLSGVWRDTLLLERRTKIGE